MTREEIREWFADLVSLEASEQEVDTILALLAEERKRCAEAEASYDGNTVERQGRNWRVYNRGWGDGVAALRRAIEALT